MEFFQNGSDPPPQEFWNFWGTFPKVQLFRNFWGTFLCPISPNIWGKVPQNFWIWSTPHPFVPKIPKWLVHKKCPKTFGLLRNPPAPLWKKSIRKLPFFLRTSLITDPPPTSSTTLKKEEEEKSDT